MIFAFCSTFCGTIRYKSPLAYAAAISNQLGLHVYLRLALEKSEWRRFATMLQPGKKTKDLIVPFNESSRSGERRKKKTTICCGVLIYALVSNSALLVFGTFVSIPVLHRQLSHSGYIK